MEKQDWRIRSCVAQAAAGLPIPHSLTHLEAHAALALGLEHGLHLLLALGGGLLRLLLGFLRMEERDNLLINTFVVCDGIRFQR